MKISDTKHYTKAWTKIDSQKSWVLTLIFHRNLYLGFMPFNKELRFSVWKTLTQSSQHRWWYGKEWSPIFHIQRLLSHVRQKSHWKYQLMYIKLPQYNWNIVVLNTITPVYKTQEYFVRIYITLKQWSLSTNWSYIH
jgi:hypothetical protein